MALNKQDVVRIARLARLELPPERLHPTQIELNKLLHLIERLSAVETQGIEPLAHPLSVKEEVTLRLREDRATESASLAEREILMANAPAHIEGLFLVPKVID